MKLFLNSTAIAVTILCLTFTACKKDNNTTPVSQPEVTTGDFKLEFEHIWLTPATEFALNTAFIHPVTGDTLTFSTFKYYVSNIRLKKTDGTWWSDKESYFLIDASVPNSNVLNLKNVPSGSYTQMEYTLGVDSLRNVSGAQTGALSLDNGMFWSWNSGYIMLKAEGTTPNAASGSFAFHLGGFQGANNIVTTRSTDFSGATLEINPKASPQVHMVANPALLWNHGVSCKSVSSIMMPGPDAKVMAGLFYNDITFEHIHP